MEPTIKELVTWFATVETPDELAEIKRLTDYRLNLPELRNALYARLSVLLQTTAQPPSVDCICQDGIIYDLNEWLTLKEYANRYALESTNVLSNWISRGIVPPDAVVEVRLLNSLKLIRNQPYKTR